MERPSLKSYTEGTSACMCARTHERNAYGRRGRNGEAFVKRQPTMMEMLVEDDDEVFSSQNSCNSAITLLF
jgi:hypothetical protein